MSRLWHEDGFNRFFAKFFGPGLSDALSPVGHAGRVDGQRVLEELHAAQILIVRVFHPTGHHIFIAQVVGVLEIVQRDHQPRADGRAALVWTIGLAEGIVQSLPIDHQGHFDQWVGTIDDP